MTGLIQPPRMDEHRAALLQHALQGKRVAVLAAGAPQENQGGAERFYEGLLQGFIALGAKAELVFVEANEANTGTILENFARARALDLSQFDMVVSTKVPTYAIKHPHHVLYLVHTVRVFDDMFEDTFIPPQENHFSDRSAIHRLDFAALASIPHRFAIGTEVKHRLYRWRGLDCTVMHPPLLHNPFTITAATAAPQDAPYFFIAGRLHPWKRLDLLIQAVQQSALPLRLLIAGSGEAEQSLRALAGMDTRIEFLGRVSDTQLVSYYANALAVPFVPLREDYGYITLEAFASSKPVITCTDAGEPAYLVEHQRTGLVVKPSPSDLCQALEWAYTHPDAMQAMGQAAHHAMQVLSWQNVALTLASAALEFPIAHPGASTNHSTTRVLVMDMQPIDPPLGGGRQRLLGLYHGLGTHLPCRYLGSYDWPGESYRELELTPTLLEIDVPLSPEHHAAAQQLASQFDGMVVIDLAFSQQAHLSPAYLERVRHEIPQAQVLVFSHPWVFPLVQDQIRSDQIVIYDAQNVEGYLRAQLIDKKFAGRKDLLTQVCSDEAALGQRANWILTCSHEDLQRFFRVYGFAPAKMRVVPNGVMAFTAARQRNALQCRTALGLDPEAQIAIFVGSSYGPNLEAAVFILHDLAPTMPEVHFVIAGGVSSALSSELSNVTLTGPLSEDQKDLWLGAARFALNPMFSGSGTNIKMFDFMASHLPVITTEVGARGIETSYRSAMQIVQPTVAAHHAAIAQLANADALAIAKKRGAGLR